jgi:hypothetical protein
VLIAFLCLCSAKIVAETSTSSFLPFHRVQKWAGNCFILVAGSGDKLETQALWEFMSISQHVLSTFCSLIDIIHTTVTE